MGYAEITAVKGVRNDVSPERFAPGDLLYGRNIDIDESGRAQRRAGTATVFAGSAHSAFSDGAQGLFVQGGQLKRFLPDGSFSNLTSILGSRLAYAAINGTVFWTDGITSGAVVEGKNRSWGVAPPPQLTPGRTVGSVHYGTYLCTMTYVEADGRESGAPMAVAVMVGAVAVRANEPDTPGGIVFASLPVSDNPRVVRKNIYVSTPGGDLPLLTANVSNATTSFTLTKLPEQTVPVRTQFFGPPPAGQVLGHYKGRAYVASGPFLLYSQPFEYELFDLRNGFLVLDSAIQTISPVADGIFVGTKNRTVFLAGDQPEKFDLRPVAPHGTVLGTEISVSADVMAPADSGDAGADADTYVMWTSRLGLTVGRNGGSAKDLTARQYIPPAASVGAALLKRRSATPQYVASLFN